MMHPSPDASPSRDAADAAQARPTPTRVTSRYPSWLPKRPNAPQGLVGEYRSSTEESTRPSSDTPVRLPTRSRWTSGREPTARSVRVVTLPDEEISPTAAPRVPSQAHSRAAAPDPSAAPFNTEKPNAPVPHQPASIPRFRAPGLHLDLLRNPSRLSRTCYRLLPLFIFAHVPLQAFFDFNAAYILLQIAKHPTPAAPGVSASGANWALGCAAYFACFFIWFFGVFICYELVYSFWRLWRVKRPEVMPIYLSSPAHTLVSLTSYANYCFLHYIRAEGFRSSLRDGLAETAYWYSQNLPTVTLLIPRAALCLALLLSFSQSSPLVIAQSNSGAETRDGTFFRAGSGALTLYARGVLIANCAWTLWRILVLITSWIALWVFSGLLCGGICGPQYRWEEEDFEYDEKVLTRRSRARGERLIDRWGWLAGTTDRIQDAYNFCVTSHPATRNSTFHGSTQPPMLELPSTINRPLALSTAPLSVPDSSSPLAPPLPANTLLPTPVAPVYHQTTPLRRGILTGELFAAPPVATTTTPTKPPPSIHPKSSLVPLYDTTTRQTLAPEPFASVSSGPLLNLPFPILPPPNQPAAPLTTLPFPLQPVLKTPRRQADVPVSALISSEEYDPEHETDDYDDEARDIGSPLSSDLMESTDYEPRMSSEGGTSASLSSLGQPILSRYPFEFRTPIRGPRSSRGTGTDSGPSKSSSSRGSRMYSSIRSSHPSSSSPYGHSREHSIAESPEASFSTGTSPVSPSVHIPPPPRHPALAAGMSSRRARAGTVPSPSNSARPSDISLRMRTTSTTDQTFGISNPIPLPPIHSSDLHAEEGDDADDVADESEQPSYEEDPEKEDSVGLLSQDPSPKSSLGAIRARASSLVSGHRQRRGSAGASNSSGSGSGQRSRTTSFLSRSRTHSAVSGPAPTASTASLPRSRTQSSSGAQETNESAYSDARTHATGTDVDDVLEGDDDDDEDDHTFGIPPHYNWDDVPRRSSGVSHMDTLAPLAPSSPATARFVGGVRRQTSRLTAHSQQSQQTVSQATHTTQADLSEAPSSYVTAAPTMDDSTTTQNSNGTIRTTNTWANPYRNMM